MGYYSIYKIIKDIIKTLYNSKIMKYFLILVLILTFLFTYNKVFAVVDVSYLNTATFSENIFNQDITLRCPSDASNYNYSCLMISDSSSSARRLYFILSNTPIILDITPVSNGTYASFTNNDNTSIKGYLCNHTGSSLYNNFYFDFQNSNITTSQTTTQYSFKFTNSTTPNINDYLIYADHTIKDTNGNTIYNSFTPPSLSNTQSDLENLSFNNFIINANSYSEDISNNDGTLFMLFYNRSLSNSNNTDGLYPIKEKGFTKGSIYTDSSSTDDNLIFNFPIFQSGVFFNIGSTYEIKFAYKTYNNDGTWQYNYFDNNYIFTISSNVTQDYINQLNQQTATTTDEENQQNMEDAINNQTQSIDNINNSINDSNVDNSSVNLPTDNTQDITQNGVDNIFQTIYNSFTSGTAQDIVFPIPFTNKSIILQPNYVYNMLYNSNATWVITIIQAFWWYLISRFIISDIMNKIRKIKQGNFDNIQNSNIKEDML